MGQCSVFTGFFSLPVYSMGSISGRCVGKAVDNSENRSSNPASCLADPGNIRKRKIEEDTSGKSKTAIFHKWQPLSAYRLGRFLPWEASFRGIAVRKSFQQEV